TNYPKFATVAECTCKDVEATDRLSTGTISHPKGRIYFVELPPHPDALSGLEKVSGTEQCNEASRRALEAAVGHEYHVVAMPSLRAQRREQCIDAGRRAAAPVQGVGDAVRIPRQLGPMQEH